jgi:geranylgeranyl reductase family protein
MKIGVVGAGAAGSYASYLLAEKGEEVTLFDHKVPWEKPCGGGVTWKGIKSFPFLKDNALQPSLATEVKFISPEDNSQLISLPDPIYTFSRKKLGSYLLHKAEEAGAHHRKERVLKVRENAQGWEIITNESSYPCDLLIGADGAQSIVRRMLGIKLDKNRWCLGLLALAQGDFGSTLIIKFVAGLSGYIWIFPRRDVASIGICSDLTAARIGEMKDTLIQFLKRECNFTGSGAQFKSAVIPVVSEEDFKHNKISGRSWALVGDAAGFADPITGEGIYYALRSAQLLVESYENDGFLDYPGRLKKDFLPHLITAARLKKKFYTTSFMKRMFFWIGNSPSVKRIVPQVMNGGVGYVQLKRKLMCLAPLAAAEALYSTLSRRFSAKK